MKKVSIILIAAMAMISCGNVYTGKTIELTNLNDSMNYALGLVNGAQLKMYQLRNDSSVEAVYVLADYRLARSPEDTRMLDIFFDSKTFDVDQTAKVTGLESAIWALAKAGNADGVASTISATKRTASKTVDRFLASLDKYYD